MIIVPSNVISALQSNTVALLHGDGVNNSTTIIDSSGGPDWTAGNAAKISTDQSKFGGASLFFPDSSRDYVAPPVPISFGLEDFTFETWFFTGGNGGYPLYTLLAFDGGGGTGLWYLGGGGPGLAVKQGGVTKIEVYPNIPYGAWHHIALCRYNGVTTVYWNGVARGSFADSYDYPAASGFPTIGGATASPSSGAINLWMDEVRINLGLSSYTENFTPPTAPFTDDGDRPAQPTVEPPAEPPPVVNPPPVDPPPVEPPPVVTDPPPVVTDPGPTGPVDTGVTGPVEPPPVVVEPQPPARPQHDPVTTEFTPGMAQVYTIPDWCDAVDIVAIGGGGGGQGGGALQSDGEHGAAGTWGGTTKLAADFPSHKLYVTVGTGGDAGRGPLKGVGTDGHGCTVSDGTTTVLEVAGGSAGGSGVTGGDPNAPAVPPYTFRDVTYPGTAGSVKHDPPPAPAGHGVGGAGGDGNVVGGGHGGAGGPGKVWIRAYQTT